MKISYKLLLGTAIVLLMTVMVGVIANSGMNSLFATSTKLYDGPLQSINFSRTALSSFLRFDKALDQVFMSEDFDSAEEYLDLAEEYEEAVIEELEIVAERISRDEEGLLPATVAQMEQAGVLRGEAYAIFEAEGSLEGLAELVERKAELFPEIGENLETIADNATEQGYFFLEDAKVQKAEITNLLLVALALSVVMGLAIIIVLARGIAVPLSAITSSINALADGEDEVDIPGMKRKDEIGVLARAADVFRARAEVTIENNKQIQLIMGEFEDNFRSARGILFDAFNNTSEAAREMLSSCGTTNMQVEAVAAASDCAAGNVDQLVMTSSALSDRITDVAQKFREFQKLSDEAVSRSDETERSIAALSQASDRIGEVAALIESIAQQTNLLALNATIEAARAGEYGKGFAVVAGEVKNLAAQTADATESISGHIQEIRGTAVAAMDLIRGIGEVIQQLNEGNREASTSVDAQLEATSEIAGHADGASQGTALVMAEVSKISEEAESSLHAAENLQSTSGQLEELVMRLDQDVAALVKKVAQVG